MKNKYIVTLALLGLFSKTLLAQVSPLDGNWELELAKSDEFSADVLDRNKWGHQLWFDCSKEVFLSENNVTVENGFLKIEVKEEVVQISPEHLRCYNTIYYKTAGALISNFEVGADSYIEVRAKLVDVRADVTSAIWISDEPHKDKNPNIEIDIIETLESRSKPKHFTSTMHVWYRDQDNKSSGHIRLDGIERWMKRRVSRGFHVFGLERRGDFIRLYLNGKIYWERNMLDFPEFVDKPRKLIINVEGHNGTPKKGNYPQELLVDYIRVYKFVN